MNGTTEEQQKTKWRDNPVSWGSFLIAVIVTVGSLGAQWVGYEKRLATLEETVRIYVAESEKDQKEEVRFRAQIITKLDGINQQLTTALASDAVTKARLDLMQSEIDRLRGSQKSPILR